MSDTTAPEAPDKTIAVPTTITVTRTVKIDGTDEAAGSDDPEEEMEEIEVHRFATQPAMVRFSYPLKMTKSFQSVGIEVGVEVPCYVEEIEDGLEKASQLVAARLKVEVPKLRQTLDKLASLSGR